MASFSRRTRRSLLTAVRVCKRGAAGIPELAEEIQGDRFFSRRSELAALDNLLRPQRGTAGRLVILSGPKDSGKSTLLAEYRRRQAHGQYLGTSCIADMRNAAFGPSGMARMFKSSFLQLKNVKVGVGPAKVGTTVEAELEKVKQTDGLLDCLEAIRSFGVCWAHALKSGYAGGFPTIIIDEANMLHSWAADDESRKHLVQLLAFFVMVTKQQCLMNVVLASSENFFREWVMRFIRPNRAVLVNIGDLPEEEARQFLNKLTAPEVISDELWRDIFYHVGGRMGLLVQLASFTAQWDTFKFEMASNCRGELTAALVPQEIEEDKPSPPKWSRDEWVTVMKALVAHEDGVVSYEWLCDQLSPGKVNSLIEYDLLHYRPYTTWGADIVRPPESYPLVMPTSRLHLREMQKLVRQF